MIKLHLEETKATGPRAKGGERREVSLAVPYRKYKLRRLNRG